MRLLRWIAGLLRRPKIGAEYWQRAGIYGIDPQEWTPRQIAAIRQLKIPKGGSSTAPPRKSRDNVFVATWLFEPRGMEDRDGK